MDLPVEWKIKRLADGEVPRVFDVFAGCGGFSLGFVGAGFHVVGAVEHDELARETYALNLLKGPRLDITTTDPAVALATHGVGQSPELAVDVLIGGPPCQCFARIGRAKLRALARDPQAYRNDERGQLYQRYLEYVKALQPLALVMENVIDMANYGGVNVPDEMCLALGDLGYRCDYTVLNAAHYGVPQLRDRLFVVGFREELELEPSFPKASHSIEVPRGYAHARQAALGQVSVHESVHSGRLKRAVTACEALKDLPPIRGHLTGAIKRGPRNLQEGIPYARLNPGRYARMMRNYRDVLISSEVTAHVIRYLPRDFPIFERMEEGAEYPRALEIAREMFSEKVRRLKLREGTAEYTEALKATVPPYPDHIFPNKWRKMEAQAPARTLMAHLGKDSYTHIHYDSTQARTISVREAARLQSFPDGFRFQCSMNPAFRQIGNAVPPLMAEALARHLASRLDSAVRRAAAPILAGCLE